MLLQELATVMAKKMATAMGMEMEMDPIPFINSETALCAAPNLCRLQKYPNSEKMFSETISTE